MTRYGFLGPETTFTHQALLQALAARGLSAAESELVPFGSVAEATGALLAGQIDALMAPIENSVEGGVSGTLDVLAATDAITIIAEQVVPITFVLAAREPMALEQVQAVASHPHAQAQVQGWIRATVPDARVDAASSTAAAARDLASCAPDDALGRAAICAPLAAEHYGLAVLAEGIEDTSGAQTRFVLVAREGRIPARTGADRTTLVVKLAHDRAGALLEALELFNTNGVNLSRIESRPTGDTLGRYSFSIDVEGHLEDRRVAAALAALHRVCPQVHFLGSYPRFDGAGAGAGVDAGSAAGGAAGATAGARSGCDDASYDAANAWVQQLRDMIGPR